MFNQGSYQEMPIGDINLASAMAYAEKPGRDYLHENPDLPAKKVTEVMQEIGAAAIHVERRMDDTFWLDSFLLALDPVDPSFDPYPIPHPLEKFVYKSIPEKPRKPPMESPLVAEWARMPGLKLIDGRPVVGKEDMNKFADKQVAKGMAPYKKGRGTQAWNVLSEARESSDHCVYVPWHPYYGLQQTCNQLYYFDANTAGAAGLQANEYLDILSLWNVVQELPGTLRGPLKNWPKDSTYSKITPALAGFTSDFLHDTLGTKAVNP